MVTNGNNFNSNFRGVFVNWRQDSVNRSVGVEECAKADTKYVGFGAKPTDWSLGGGN